jgi:hypothetical protein
LVDLSVEHWRSAADFHRALIGVLSRNAGSQIVGAWLPGRTYTRDLIGDLAAAGGIEEAAPLDALATALMRTFKSVCQEWSSGELTLEEAGRDLGMAYGVILTGFVTPQAKAALTKILERYQA